MPEEDNRSAEELQDALVWDEDDTAQIPDEDDSEYLDRRYGREY
jgi:hypothetical protein